MNVGELIGVLTGIVAIIGLLARIAWSLGRLMQQFSDHLVSSEKIHADQEHRLRNMEAKTRRLR